MPFLESVIRGVISLPSSQEVLPWMLFLVFKETARGEVPGLIPCVLFFFTGSYLGIRVEVSCCFGHGAPFLLCLPLRFNEDTL